MKKPISVRATGRELVEFLKDPKMLKEYGDDIIDVDEDSEFKSCCFADFDLDKIDLERFYLLTEFGVVTGDVSRVPFRILFQEWKERISAEDPRRKSPRYPYYYAEQLVNPHLGSGPEAIKSFARFLGMAHHELAEKLADFYLENEEEVVDASLKTLGLDKNPL